MLTKANVKPKDIETHGHFFGTIWQNTEKETIARNIVLISQWNKNTWLDFTWEQYQAACEHEVTVKEESILDSLVRDGSLTCENGVYSVTDEFVQALEKYLKNKGAVK